MQKVNSRNQYSWIGREEMCLHTVSVKQCDQIVIGKYGGNIKSGAHKNEDGLFVSCSEDWEFAMILDGHYSAESTALLVNTIKNEFHNFNELLQERVESAFQSIQQHILSIFTSEKFKTSCQKIQGETACLICVRKENYIWWFSVGDCLVYVLHEELHQLGQYMLNQRHFYEWVGFVNTFSLPVPCYSSGIRELRTGKNRIVMVTDGVLECGEHRYETPVHLYKDLYENKENETLESSVEKVLQHVHKQLGRDSATIISWDYDNQTSSTYPSDMQK
ncbi:protein phosphatase [Bacillus manliponensis]|uniref:Protein phosphatase n=1 Tax=Bacillus manliponensis TaxID=574376 RepID=A0A073JV92_9BACI|nr:PP2C family serine/threonine-protein phosphatase [Bacillus manliponensis]KEK18230.1 protein phosphatase [Bacillus manliponensis]